MTSDLLWCWAHERGVQIHIYIYIYRYWSSKRVLASA